MDKNDASRRIDSVTTPNLGYENGSSAVALPVAVARVALNSTGSYCAVAAAHDVRIECILLQNDVPPGAGEVIYC